MASDVGLTTVGATQDVRQWAGAARTTQLPGLPPHLDNSWSQVHVRAAAKLIGIRRVDGEATYRRKVSG